MIPHVAIIDYGMGNVFSLSNALVRCGAKPTVTRRIQDMRNATHIVLPGDGAFKTGMENLKKFDLVKPLEEEVIKKEKPFLGICIGMQLLASEGTEDGKCTGLGWIDGRVNLLETSKNKLPLPHIGWDDITGRINHSLLREIPQGADFYFIHSYHIQLDQQEAIVAWCEYGQKFAAVIQRKNIIGTQFHPEKSQKYGLQILKNFLSC